MINENAVKAEYESLRKKIYALAEEEIREITGGSGEIDRKKAGGTGGV